VLFNFKIQAQLMRIENCPRCLARSAVKPPAALTALLGMAE
jgi:hypothetical protein